MLKEFPLSAVTIDDAFWNARLTTNRTVSLHYQLEQLKTTGRLDNFRKAAGTMSGKFQGRCFNDSDAYKWIEAASYSLTKYDDPVLAEEMQSIVELVRAAQEPDGYLNSYFTVNEPDKKWTNLGIMHELYCAGHLFQAAAAHVQATGTDTLVTVAKRCADHIYDVFGPEGRRGIAGHPEVEVGLIDLYRVTGEERYLKLAVRFVEQRGQPDSPIQDEYENLECIAGDESSKISFRQHFERAGHYCGEYCQDHMPLRNQTEAVGHAVRATYLYAGATDVAALSGDEGLFKALLEIWHNMTGKRMYVTGGIGSAWEDESFGPDYDLPNASSYAETCAAVGSIMWSHRLSMYKPESKFADSIERTLYNAVLAGVSLTGDRFFYTNPLESDGIAHPYAHQRRNRFSIERQGWFTTACCPPNVARLFASLEKYIYLQRDSEVWINQFIASTVKAEISGQTVTITQNSSCPWDGLATFSISAGRPVTMKVLARVPAWCDHVELELNGEPLALQVENGYAVVERMWQDNDELTLRLTMPVMVVESHPCVKENRGRIALIRGPLVYCVEQIDNRIPVGKLAMPVQQAFVTKQENHLLGGIKTIRGRAIDLGSVPGSEELYGPVKQLDADKTEEFVAIPYYAWANRGRCAMTVWIHKICS